MTNVIEFIRAQNGNLVRAMNDGQQLAFAEAQENNWVAGKSENGKRYWGREAKETLLMALGIEVQARIERVEFTYVQYTNGMVSYEGKK